MTTEQLIEKTFEDEWYRLDGVTEPERHRRALRAALAVFEEAHTPTNDERDGLRRAIASVLWNAGNYPDRVQAALLGQSVAPLVTLVHDAVLAAGFRRSVSSESSDESVPCPECGEPRPFGLDFMCLDCNGVRYVSENDWYAHHGCGFEEEWKYQWEAREAIDKHRASCDWPEPQAEPSDAQVEAALQALGHSRSGVTPPNMRAALRAASEAKGEGHGA